MWIPSEHVVMEGAEMILIHKHPSLEFEEYTKLDSQTQGQGWSVYQGDRFQLTCRIDPSLHGLSLRHYRTAQTAGNHFQVRKNPDLVCNPNIQGLRLRPHCLLGRISLLAMVLGGHATGPDPRNHATSPLRGGFPGRRGSAWQHGPQTLLGLIVPTPFRGVLSL